MNEEVSKVSILILEKEQIEIKEKVEQSKEETKEELKEEQSLILINHKRSFDQIINSEEKLNENKEKEENKDELIILKEKSNDNQDHYPVNKRTKWLETLECSICLNPYDTKKRSPLLLNCGHTYCESCLKYKIKIPKDDNIKNEEENIAELSCHVCTEITSCSMSELRINYTLLDLIQIIYQEEMEQKIQEMFRKSDVDEKWCQELLFYWDESLENKKLIEKLGGFEKLKEIIIKNKKNTDILENIYHSFYLILLNERACIKFIDLSMFDILIETITQYDQENPDLLFNAYGVLQNVMCHKFSNSIFVEIYNGFEILLKQITLHRKNIKVLQSIFGVLANIESTIYKKIQKEDYLEHVKFFIDIIYEYTHEETFLESIICVLYSFLGARVIHDAEIVLKILTIMVGHSNNKDIIKYSARTLISTAYHDETTQLYIINKDGLSLIINCIMTHINQADVLKYLCNLLGELSYYQENNAKIQELGADKLCYDMIKLYPDNHKLMKEVFYILQNILIKSNEITERISASEGLKLFFIILKKNTESEEFILIGIEILKRLIDIHSDASINMNIPVLSDLLNHYINQDKVVESICDLFHSIIKHYSYSFDITLFNMFLTIIKGKEKDSNVVKTVLNILKYKTIESYVEE